ncbi:MAG TPA: glycosyltransferase [Pirellulales bacterium]|nr:glycosyltransferase [Pirellulales bacterium]
MLTPLSVLMPVYNAERYVAEAVESILAQTFGDFELLIIDDGSTDRSAEILVRYASREPRIRLTRRPNTGHLAALNEMLARARGEFVARMDADDVALPDRFERQLAYLRTHPECLAVGCALANIDEDGDLLCEERLPLDHDEIDRQLLRGQGGLSHPAAMIRRAALVELSGYRPPFYGAEDKDLWLRLAERGRLANLPEVLMKYRVHAENFGFRNYERSLAALQAALSEAYQRRGLACPADLMANVPKPTSGLERRRACAWSAVHSGQFATARKHALAILRQQPRAKASWVLLAYACLGPKADALRRLYRQLRGWSP